ncbi:probable inactive purple acid phosphatase 28 isoform X2 [Gastrolobium bilobum]|uniref:probable inactive purple acid phosphatase 28 isoform X2 n=1 Tax=Gastrolobium bilobum TaxID=150636 RepID=UPI002AAF8135|nr:probable inactive purple acid phosphatase 28 isoform X2 [Gastrolobium bilobum]
MNTHRSVMDSCTTENWKHSLLYLTFVLAILHITQSHLLRKLFLGNETVRIKKIPDLPLRFRSDGTFKILQVADMHYGSGSITRCRDVLASEFEFCSDLNTTRFLKRIIQAENPDFIAFTGDNIFGSSTPDAAESLFKAFGPATESGLPWAAVLGNHDQESTMNREELMSFISLMDYSVSQINPSADNLTDPTKGGMMTKIDGFGNYNLRVYGAPGSMMTNSTVLNLFFLDSGDRAVYQGIRTYGWIKDSQLQWLRRVSQEFQQDPLHPTDAISPTKPPALAFFHIPIPEIPQLFYKETVGQFQEGVACSRVNSGVLQTFVSMGDVKAVFIGHDHTNDFCGNLHGIWFCYGGGFGYHGYGKAGWPRRARIILAELHKGKMSWMDVKRIMTWKRLDDEKLSKIDEQILWLSR